MIQFFKRISVIFAPKKLKSFREFEKKDWQLLTVSVVKKIMVADEIAKSSVEDTKLIYDYYLSVLEQAVRYSSSKVVQCLLDYGFNPKFKKDFFALDLKSSLCVALGNGREDNACVLIKNGASVDLEVFRYALEQVDLKPSIYRLLKKTFDRNLLKNKNNESLSHYDAYKYYEKIGWGYKPIIDVQKIVQEISDPKQVQQIYEFYRCKTEKQLHQEWVKQRRQRTRV